MFCFKLQQVPESVLCGKLPQVTAVRDDFEDEDDEDIEIEVPSNHAIKVINSADGIDKQLTEENKNYSLQTRSSGGAPGAVDSKVPRPAAQDAQAALGPQVLRPEHHHRGGHGPGGRHLVLRHPG